MIIIQHMIILQREKNLKMFVVFPTEKVVVNGYLIRFVLTFSSPFLSVPFSVFRLIRCRCTYASVFFSAICCGPAAISKQLFVGDCV